MRTPGLMTTRFPMRAPKARRIKRRCAEPGMLDLTRSASSSNQTLSTSFDLPRSNDALSYLPRSSTGQSVLRLRDCLFREHRLIQRYHIARHPLPGEMLSCVRLAILSHAFEPFLDHIRVGLFAARKRRLNFIFVDRQIPRSPLAPSGQEFTLFAYNHRHRPCAWLRLPIEQSSPDATATKRPCRGVGPKLCFSCQHARKQHVLLNSVCARTNPCTRST